MSSNLTKKKQSVIKDIKQSKVPSVLKHSFRSNKKSHKKYKLKPKDKPWVLYHKWRINLVPSVNTWEEYGRFTTEKEAIKQLNKNLRSYQGLSDYERNKDLSDKRKKELVEYYEDLKARWKIEYEQ